MSNTNTISRVSALEKGTNKLVYVECPRDAMQGWVHQIPTSTKIAYLNALLKVGFPVLDFGSFVSPKAIPQLSDTAEVLAGLELDPDPIKHPTKLLAIVANLRGAEAACSFKEISYLGFPFSVSETFQLRNTNSTREESFIRVSEIQELCLKNGKQLVIYLSMGFGNPYGDPYSAELLAEWAEKIAGLGIKIISLADTVGLATTQQITTALTHLIPQYPLIEFGVHLHSTPEGSRDKIAAALKGGCLRFDGALKGIGGCPMAGNDLVGNMDTELILGYLKEQGLHLSINEAALNTASNMTTEVFI